MPIIPHGEKSSTPASTPSYYAIIPADVRYSKDVPPNAKLLYGEITALCNKEGYCWSSNEHFAELYDVKVLAIKRWTKALEDAGFIHVLLDVTGTKRRICIDEAVSKKIRGGIKNDTGWYPKRYAPRTKKDTHSIKENTLKNNKKSIAALAAPEVLASLFSGEDQPGAEKPAPGLFPSLDALTPAEFAALDAEVRPRAIEATNGPVREHIKNGKGWAVVKPMMKARLAERGLT